jgi:hypothetical protein
MHVSRSLFQRHDMCNYRAMRSFFCVNTVQSTHRCHDPAAYSLPPRLSISISTPPSQVSTHTSLPLPRVIHIVHVQSQARCVQVHLVLTSTLLQNLCDIPRVLNLPQLQVALALLDGFTNEFG